MLYRDIHASMLKFCTGFKVEMAALALDLDVIYFDAHGDETTLPQKDLVGLSGLSMETNGGLIEVQAMIGIATLSDTNLFRLVKLIDQLFAKLMPDKLIKLYDADTGANKGVLKIMNGTRVMPVAGTDTRPVQYVFITAGSDQVMRQP